MEGSLDLNDHLIRHPAATFFLRAEGESMRSAGIHPGDLLVVDRAIEPRDGSVVVAAVDGHLTVKRLQLREGSAWLAPDTDDPAHAAIPLSEATDCRVWGVVTAVIHKP